MRLDDVQLRYSRRGPLVLTGVDAALKPGEAAVVLGRNGAGKSTLLQVVAGVLTPTRGRVVGRPRAVGWLPEQFPADQPFTVRTYLRSMAAVRRVPQAGTAIDGWAERLGFDTYLDERLPALSKGTARKVGLAQALLLRPDLLVLDEPWEGLDAQTRDGLPAIIEEVRDAGGSVLISDHLGETAAMPDVTPWLLEDGRVTPAPSTFRASSTVPNEPPLWASSTIQVRTLDPATLAPVATAVADPATAAATDRTAPESDGHAEVSGLAAPGDGERRWVVEVSVAASDRAAAAARLRTEGHDVLGVREEMVP